MKKMKKMTAMLCALVLAFILIPVSGASGTITTVTPVEDTTTLLKNPGMGLVLYAENNVEQCFTSQTQFWYANNWHATKASILYIRAPWSLLEPTEGCYAWENDPNFIALVEGARSREIKLAFRVYVDSTDSYTQATPDWVRQAGARGYTQNKAIGNIAPNASLSTTAGTSQDTLVNIADNNTSNSWSSGLGVSFPQYITLDYGADAVSMNSMSVVTHYGQGQGISNATVQYWDGTKWIDTTAKNVGISWDKNNDAEEVRNIPFSTISSTKFRLKINSANMTWNHFTINELYANNPVVISSMWSPYVDDSLFRAKFERFLTAFAAEYDNPDIVDYIDAMGLGWAGEMHHLYPSGYSGSVADAFNWIAGAYRSRFTRVLLGAQFAGEQAVDVKSEALVKQSNMPYDMARRDSYGSPVYFGPAAQNQQLACFNAGVPVFAENCYFNFFHNSTFWSKDHNALPDMIDQFLLGVLPRQHDGFASSCGCIVFVKR